MIFNKKVDYCTLLCFLFMGGFKMVKKGRKTGYSIGIVKKEKLLFKGLCVIYLKKCEANGISEYTIRGYKNVLKYFLKFEKNDELYCKEININMFEDFKLYLKHERKVKDITVNSYIRKLTPMLTYGMQLGYIERFPYSYVKRQEVYKDIYTDKELLILLKRS